MTGSEFYTYLLETFKRTDKSTAVYQSVTDCVSDLLDNYAWDAYKYEGYLTDISMAGAYKITLPADFGKLISDVIIVDGNSSYKLNKLTKLAYDTQYSNIMTTEVTKSKPMGYCIYDGQVLVGPVPDKLTYKYWISYSLTQSTAVTSLTADVMFSSLKYRKMLLYGSLYFLYTTLENDEQASKYKSLYEQEIDKRIATDQQLTDAAILIDAREY